ncbi:hypothetical protein CRYUN_Cryun22dG0025400 [Craigia yunnanensis]
MEKISFLFSLLLVVSFCFVSGSPPKEAIGIYELKKGDMSVKFTNWGATIISVVLPDKHGKLGDIALGYKSVTDYMNDTTYFGALVGRVANRIGGGPKGFGDVVWKVKKYKKDCHAPFIVFSYDSYDGEEGFPSELKVRVGHTLLPNNYGDILSEEIQLFASHYTPIDSQLISTGKILPVKRTPYDFLKPNTIGSRIKELPKGYDINYALDGTPGKLKKVVVVKDKKSGRVMKLFANQPGV